MSGLIWCLISLHPLVVHPPAFGPQKGRNAAVAVPPVLAGHPDDPLHELRLVIGSTRSSTLCVPGLPQHSACPAFGHHVTAERVTHMLDRLAPLRLVRPQAAVLPLPSVVRLLGHAKLPHHLGHGPPLSQPNLSLPELPK
jgi:hypothetical protein